MGYLKFVIFLESNLDWQFENFNPLLPGTVVFIYRQVIIQEIIYGLHSTKVEYDCTILFVNKMYKILFSHFSIIWAI